MTLSALLSEYPLALLLQGRDTGYFLGLESLPSPFPRANHALLCASDGKPNCFQPKTGNVGAREKKSKCVYFQVWLDPGVPTLSSSVLISLRQVFLL